MRPVAACQRAYRLGEWRTDSEGRCSYHSDGKRTITGESVATYVLTQLATHMSVLTKVNEAYDARFSGRAVRIHTPKH